MKLGVYSATGMTSDLQTDRIPLVVGSKYWSIHGDDRENEPG